jgi:hypothetical protein
MLQTSKSLQQDGKKRKRKFTGVLIHSERGKVIGDVVNRAFLKDIDNGCILYKYNSLASDICSLHEAERAGADHVEFTNTDTGITYSAPIEKFWTLGRFVDYGFGKQQALELCHFEHRRDPNHSPTTDTDTPEYPEADTSEVKPLHYESKAAVGVVFNGVRQLSLFAGGE